MYVRTYVVKLKLQCELLDRDKSLLIIPAPPSVVGSLNGPAPLTLTAATWKVYSVFGDRLETLTA